MFVTFAFVLVGIGIVVLVSATASSAETEASTPPTGLMLGVVVGAGVLTLIGPVLVDRKPECSSDGNLLVWYRTRFVLRVAFAEVPAVMGFVAFLVTKKGWMYPVGSAFAIVGFVGAVPTRGRIASDQRKLNAWGCNRGLFAALAAPRA